MAGILLCFLAFLSPRWPSRYSWGQRSSSWNVVSSSQACSAFIYSLSLRSPPTLQSCISTCIFHAPPFYRWGKLSPEKMHDPPTRHTLTCHHLRNILLHLYFTSSSGQPARYEKSEFHQLLSQTSLASQVHSGCLLLNSYMRRNSRPGMLRPCFEVKDGKLRKTLSLVSLYSWHSCMCPGVPRSTF